MVLRPAATLLVDAHVRRSMVDDVLDPQTASKLYALIPAVERLLPRSVNGRNGSIIRVRAVRFAVDVGFAAGYHCEQPAITGRSGPPNSLSTKRPPGVAFAGRIAPGCRRNEAITMHSRLLPTACPV